MHIMAMTSMLLVLDSPMVASRASDGANKTTPEYIVSWANIVMLVVRRAAVPNRLSRYCNSFEWQFFISLTYFLCLIYLKFLLWHWLLNLKNRKQGFVVKYLLKCKLFSFKTFEEIKIFVYLPRTRS